MSDLVGRISEAWSEKARIAALEARRRKHHSAISALGERESYQLPNGWRVHRESGTYPGASPSLNDPHYSVWTPKGHWAGAHYSPERVVAIAHGSDSFGRTPQVGDHARITAGTDVHHGARGEVVHVGRTHVTLRTDRGELKREPHRLTTSAAIRSYDPQAGPSAAEKARNARIMRGSK